MWSLSYLNTYIWVLYGTVVVKNGQAKNACSRYRHCFRFNTYKWEGLLCDQFKARRIFILSSCNFWIFTQFWNWKRHSLWFSIANQTKLPTIGPGTLGKVEKKLDKPAWLLQGLQTPLWAVGASVFLCNSNEDFFLFFQLYTQTFRNTSQAGP